jgi:hypothetical protein
MSRSNPNAGQQSNPATRFFEWSGSDGKIKYYDKAADETIKLDLPFSFLVLDQLHTITGFNKRDSGYWSNEVRDITNDVLTVKTKAGVKAEGVYNSAAVANQLAAGAKYTKSVYIAYMNDEKELVLGHIKFAGSAIAPWIEFTNNNNVDKIAVVIEDATAAKNGNTDYFFPVFGARAVTPETDAKAVELDKELQDYLGQYLTSKRTEPSKRVAAEDVEIEDVGEQELDGDVEESDGPEEPAPKPAAKPAAKPKEVDTGNGKIDIKDVPF